MEVSYFLHATEDADRVGKAVADLLGGIGEWRSDVLEGHYGNRIVRQVLKLKGDEAASAFAELLSRLPRGVKLELSAAIERYLDEHSALYLRLDKQKLLAGDPALADADPVRIRVKPRLHRLRGGAASYFRGLIR